MPPQLKQVSQRLLSSIGTLIILPFGCGPALEIPTFSPVAALDPSHDLGKKKCKLEKDSFEETQEEDQARNEASPEAVNQNDSYDKTPSTSDQRKSNPDSSVKKAKKTYTHNKGKALFTKKGAVKTESFGGTFGHSKDASPQNTSNSQSFIEQLRDSITFVSSKNSIHFKLETFVDKKSVRLIDSLQLSEPGDQLRGSLKFLDRRIAYSKLDYIKKNVYGHVESITNSELSFRVSLEEDCWFINVGALLQDPYCSTADTHHLIVKLFLVDHSSEIIIFKFNLQHLGVNS